MSLSENATDRLEEKVKEFEHVYNPLHFYSRLIDYGINKEIALVFAKNYEEKIYKSVMAYKRHLKK